MNLRSVTLSPGKCIDSNSIYENERVRDHKQRVDTRTFGRNSVKVGRSAKLKNRNRDRQAERGVANGCHLPGVGVWIVENANTFQARNDLPQKLQAFSDGVFRRKRQPGEVPTRPRKAPDHSKLDQFRGGPKPAGFAVETGVAEG